MKILVKSTFPQSDGWGRSARDYLRAFIETKNTVRANPIVLSRTVLQPHEMPNWIPDNGNGFSPDVYFQQCLPDYFEKFPHINKHIGFTFTESRHLEKTGWIEKMREMDEMWVATPQEKINLEESGITNVKVVRMPMSFTDTDEKLTELEELIAGRFAFYTIGEFVPRKNIEDLLLAYWKEFNRHENVVLVLKTNLGLVKAEDLGVYIKQQIDHLQKTYRLYEYAHHYPEVLIITEKLTDEDIMKLHNTCDCFVSTSYGESTCRPLVDAAYVGNKLICTDNTGASDPLIKMVRVPSREVPCIVSNPPLTYLYTSWETWMRVDSFELQKSMRQVMVNGTETNTKEEIKQIFDYGIIANQISNSL